MLAVRGFGPLNGDGQRVRKTVAGVATTYLVDDLNPTGYAQVLVRRPPMRVAGPRSHDSMCTGWTW